MPLRNGKLSTFELRMLSRWITDYKHDERYGILLPTKEQIKDLDAQGQQRLFNAMRDINAGESALKGRKGYNKRKAKENIGQGVYDLIGVTMQYNQKSAGIAYAQGNFRANFDLLRQVQANQNNNYNENHKRKKPDDLSNKKDLNKLTFEAWQILKDKDFKGKVAAMTQPPKEIYDKATSWEMYEVDGGYVVYSNLPARSARSHHKGGGRVHGRFTGFSRDENVAKTIILENYQGELGSLRAKENMDAMIRRQTLLADRTKTKRTKFNSDDLDEMEKEIKEHFGVDFHFE